MASITKVKGGYRAQIKIMVGGVAVRDSATYVTKAQASAWAHDREKSLRGQGESGVVVGKTFADACTRYEIEVSRTKRGHRWEALRLAAMVRVPIADPRPVPMGDYQLSDMTPDIIGKWRDSRLTTVSGATVNREFNLLSHVLSTARDEWQWISGSPTTKVRRPKESTHRERRPTAKEIEQISMYCGFYNEPITTKMQAVAVAFLFSIESAMRQGEVCKLVGDYIDGAVVHLPGAITKNGHKRDVPLSKRALELLSFLPEVADGKTPMFMLKADSMSVLFAKVCSMCLIDDLHFHDSRHEAITRLAKIINVLDLARMTGHRDIKQLQTYYNESAHNIAPLLG